MFAGLYWEPSGSQAAALSGTETVKLRKDRKSPPAEQRLRNLTLSYAYRANFDYQMLRPELGEHTFAKQSYTMARPEDQASNQQ